MFNSFFNFTASLIKEINSNYSQVILVALACITVWYVNKEYESKMRPYIDVAIIVTPSNGGYNFSVALVNKGEKPGTAHIKSALLRVGDELYPTVFQETTTIFPGESIKLVAPIGQVNSTGVSKIQNHQYRSNRVEIELVVESKSISDEKFKYLTEVSYHFDVNQNPPVLSLISDKFK